MPLQPAYTWAETESNIRITIDNVPVKDSSQLFCADRVVKLNAAPYLLLLDLRHEIDDDASSAIITKGRKIVIQLAKAKPGIWNKLTADGSPTAIRKQREESVQRAHAKAVTAQQQRAAKKQREARAALDLQLCQEKAQRDQIEALKQQELTQERQQLTQWQVQLPAGAARDARQQQLQDQGDESDYEDEVAAAAGEADDGLISAPDHPEYHGRGFWPGKAQRAGRAGCACTPAADMGTQAATTSSLRSSSDSGDGAASSPACSQDIISVSTSSGGHDSSLVRQQLLADIAACAQPASLRAADAPTATADSEPLLTAISSTCTTSKAAAVPQPGTPQQQQHQHPLVAHASAQQASRPHAQAPVRSRAAPVAVSFTQLETPHLPAREQREVEIKQIKRTGQQPDSVDIADRQPAFLKDKGDALAVQGNYRGAINAYSRALELDSQQPALWANRAAAHLALGRAAECVQDCDAAIELLQAAQARLQEAPDAAQARELQGSMLSRAPQEADAAEPVGTAPVTQAAACSTAASLEGGEGGACVSAASEPFSKPPEQLQAGRGQEQEQEQAQQAQSAAGSGMQPCSTGGTPALLPASAAAQSQPHLAAQLQQQLVKLLARRAAARVELQQLQQAQEDLQQALRLDPGNNALKADALEVAAALHPDSSLLTSVQHLRERAAARFKAGDMQGAAEAYTAVVDSILQQQQQQQQEEVQPDDGEQVQQQQQWHTPEQQEQQEQLVAAYSNRAACWLGLNRFQQCIDNCHAALQCALLGGACHSNTCSSRGSNSSSSSSDDVRRTGEAEAPAVPLLQQYAPQQLMAGGAPPALLKSAARIAARLAAAQGCLKDWGAADTAYAWAAACWQALGEPQKAAALAADRERVRALCHDQADLRVA